VTFLAICPVSSHPRLQRIGSDIAYGSQYMSDEFQEEIDFLGMRSSPSFVREPEGNGCAERFIRTLKENLLWIRTFETVEQLRLAVLEFKKTYNEQWIVQRFGYQRYVADRWRMDYNHYRPHSSLDSMAPAAFAAKCIEQGSATLCLLQYKENVCEILS
jgi:transposase InsO family protein